MAQEAKTPTAFALTLVAIAVAVCIALMLSFVADKRTQTVQNESAILGTWSDGHTTFTFSKNYGFVMEFRPQALVISGKWRLSGKSIFISEYLRDGSLACESEMLQVAPNGVLQNVSQPTFGRTLQRTGGPPENAAHQIAR